MASMQAIILGSMLLCTATAAFFNADGSCNPKDWPDKDHGKICGTCKVLVNLFNTKYKTCNGYCKSIKSTCRGAWEEVGDTCTVLKNLKCDEELKTTSDALCECNRKYPKHIGTFGFVFCWPCFLRFDRILIFTSQPDIF